MLGKDLWRPTAPESEVKGPEPSLNVHVGNVGPAPAPLPSRGQEESASSGATLERVGQAPLELCIKAATG